MGVGKWVGKARVFSIQMNLFKTTYDKKLNTWISWKQEIK
jgi:hypothetical protein